MAGLTIGGLARAGGTGVETVRYYQRRGLMPTPVRDVGASSAGTVRRYGPDHVHRLRFIRGAQAAGFTLKQIAELIAFAASDDRAGARALSRDRIAVLDREIATLTQARSRLARLAHQCESRDDGPCPIFQAFNDA